MVALLFLIGLVLLVAGAELLVRGSAKLASALGMTPLVIGLTVVAFGTSAPELAVSVRGAFTGNADVALGNVVGSNIANILLILGIAALVVPLVVDQQLVRWDVPILIGVGLLTWVLATLDGNLGRLDGAILLTIGVVYVVLAIRQSQKETAAVRAEYESALERGGGGAKPRLALQVLLILVGLAMLVGGATFLVDAAVVIAKWLGLSSLVIGLTVIAVGTSLPEIATSILAGLRGQRDIAVGNAIGSNLFNLVLVLGLTALVAPAGIAVPDVAIRFDLVVMVAVSVAALPIFFIGHRIGRLEAALFLAYYVAYTAYLVLAAQSSTWASHLEEAMLLFALPLTAVTLVIFVWREHRERAAARG